MRAMLRLICPSTPPVTSWPMSSGCRASGHRAVAGVRGVLGLDPGAGLRATPPEARHRDGARGGDDTRRAEIAWLTRGVGRFFPKEWMRFRDGVPVADRDGDLVEAYVRLLASPHARVREEVARNWCDWKEAVVSVESGGSPTRATRMPGSAWPRPDRDRYFRTTRGWRRSSCCARRTGSRRSPACWFMGGSTLAGLWSRHGSWRGPGRQRARRA